MTQPVLVTPMPQGNARLRKLLGIGLVIVVGLVVLQKVLLGGGGSPDTSLEDAAASGLPAAIVPQAAPEPGSVSHATTGKDPFQALRATTSGSGGGGSVAASSPPPAAPIPSPVPVASVRGPVGLPPLSDPFPMLSTPTTAPPAAPATPTPTGVQAGPIPSPSPAAVRTVSLDSVWVDGTGLLAATVHVDDASYAVTQGQDFAFSYRLLSLDHDSACGVFLYGDKRFSLCEGEQTRT